MNEFFSKKLIFIFYSIVTIIIFGFLYYFNFLSFLSEDFKFSESYNKIKEFREQNLFLSILIFLFNDNLDFFLGFGSPISILSALIFEIKLGFIIALLSSSIGASIFYFFLKI